MFTPAFIYDGSAVDLKEWQKNTAVNGNKTVNEWISPDQTFSVRVTEIAYPDFPVIEVVPELICRASETKIIEKFRTFSAVLPAEIAGNECIIRAVHGSRANTVDFCSRNFVLSEQLEEKTVSFVCEHGHSSAVWMPWLGIDISSLHGWEVAIF